MYKLLLLFFIPLSVAMASDTNDVWNPIAKKICEQIHLAEQYYNKGDLKTAHLTAIMSYFKYYDAELEPAVRVTLGGPHVFAIEGQFRDYAKAMIPNPDKKQLEKVATFATQLCDALYKDAKILNDEKVSKNVFEEASHV